MNKSLTESNSSKAQANKFQKNLNEKNKNNDKYNGMKYGKRRRKFQMDLEYFRSYVFFPFYPWGRVFFRVYILSFTRVALA